MPVVLDHIVLNIADIDRSINFYDQIVGFAVERLAEFRGGRAPFPSVRINENTLIDLFPPKMWESDSEANGVKPNLNHFCIATSLQDWQSLRDRLAQNSIELSKDKTVNFGARGDGLSMYFHDPDGNEIEARYYN